ncbi:hypothetical protein GCM10010420_55040 [Streptomyces glaucosporus]|uniref:HNH endonuclease n=1 Tax=Streptomyces glaucosporus TaxID=284044 RepID=A0ABP5W5F7_9ACTN
MAVRRTRKKQARRWRAEPQEAKRERQAQDRQGHAARLVLTVPVDGEAYRRLCACAAAHGITPRHLPGLPAERVRTTPEGLVDVAPLCRRRHRRHREVTGREFASA